jgi:hypothetical protein
MPRNGLPVTLAFTKQVLADVVGTAATILLDKMKSESFVETPSEVLELTENTILVTEDFKSKLVTCPDLGNHTSCRLGRIQQRMTIPLPDVVLQLRQMNNVNVLDIIAPHLEEVFDEIKRSSQSSDGLKQETSTSDAFAAFEKVISVQSVVVQGLITIEENTGQDFIIVSWVGTPLADMVADCALGVVYQSLSANHYLRSFWNDIHIKSPRRETTGAFSSASTIVPPSSCHHGHSHSHGHSHGGSVDDAEKKRKEEETQRTEQVVKRMKLGLLDPSQSFKSLEPKEIQSIETNALPDNRLKLERIWSYLKSSSPERVAEVSISQDGLRLIVRGNGSYELDGLPLEAYIYIHWSINRGHTLHHAVVQCVNENFRKYVISLIQKLDEDQRDQQQDQDLDREEQAKETEDNKTTMIA